MDDGMGPIVFLLLLVTGCACAWLGYTVGRAAAEYDHDKAACVERCKPAEAVFISGKCGCVRAGGES